MGKLTGKVAVVTGGGTGIGKGIAQGLAAEGAKTVITGRRIDKLNGAVEEMKALGGTAVALRADVTEEVQVNDLFAHTMELFGRVDILVNNAGAFDSAPLDEFTVEAWDRVIATNLRGPFLCTRAAFLIMKKQGVGRILNIGSISGQRPRFNSAAYTTSKFGIWGLTNVTALEGRQYGITASCLHPGNTRVERPAPGLMAPTEPMMEVEELAQVAVLMACLPAGVNMLEAIVLPVEQDYLGRG
ncbi:MAG TPA: SDR family NAD(P)-dependent oxidoreductase [Terriglobia bacterium]|nr:SDR family NAD(P)-dependent oxidoreductase [Terriglobia bacterium]